MPESFGELVHRYRRSYRWSQKVLAHLVGFSNTSHVVSIERGVVGPYPDTVKKLIDKLRIPVGEAREAILNTGTEVESAIVQSPLDVSEQQVFLTVYGHFVDRNSVKVAEKIRRMLEGVNDVDYENRTRRDRR